MTTSELTRPDDEAAPADVPTTRRVRVDLWVGVGLLAALVIARLVQGAL